jgi:hypothetical protein
LAPKHTIDKVRLEGPQIRRRTVQLNILATGPVSKLKVTGGHAHSVVRSEFDGVLLSQMISEIEQYD